MKKGREASSTLTKKATCSIPLDKPYPRNPHYLIQPNLHPTQAQTKAKPDDRHKHKQIRRSRRKSRSTEMAMAVAFSTAFTASTSPRTPIPKGLFGLTSPRRLAVSAKLARPSSVSSSAPRATVTLEQTTAAAKVMGAAFMANVGTWAGSAAAAQQIAEVAAKDDNRGSLLLLTLFPAVAWVLFNILRPALNQLDRMRNARTILFWTGLGVAGAFSVTAGDAQAAEAAQNDNRGFLILLVLAPAVIWVLYNILRPALNQLDRMRSS